MAEAVGIANVREAFTTARNRIINEHRFFAALMMAMKWIEDPTCKTAWTDGKRVGWNPAYVARLTFKQVIGLIIHEIMHPVMKHHTRRGNRDPRLWNMACDYVINILIIQYGFELPPGILYDLKYKGLTAEEVYNLLKDEERAKQEKNKQEKEEEKDGGNDEDGEESGEGSNGGSEDSEGEEGADEGDEAGDEESREGAESGDEQGETEADSEDSGQEGEGENSGSDRSGEQEGSGEEEGNQEGMGQDEEAEQGEGQGGESGEEEAEEWEVGEVRDAVNDEGEELSENEKRTEEQRWDMNATQAAKIATAAGRGFAGMDRFVSQAVKAHVTWEEHLQHFMWELAKNEYDWSRPNQRYRYHGFYLPGLHNYEVGNIVIVIDTSGSINISIFNKFMAEIKEALTRYPMRVWVVFADDRVQEAQEVSLDELETLRPKGYGGTDFRPAFDWIEREGINPKAVLYFTDLECWSYPEDPGYPVLWAIYGSARNVPFGEVITLT